jgi:RNA polymerase sigma factor (TIGR02999 family)
MTVDSTSQDAAEALWATAYADLKAIAHLRIRDTHATRLIDTTALVHESWLKLAAVKHFKPDSRRAFFAYAAKTMRSIIIDIVKNQGRAKRGGGVADVTLNPSAGMADNADLAAEPVRLDEALRELERGTPRLGQVVEMRYFGGLTENEIADVLGVTERTVRREWEKAQLILREMLAD